MDLKVFLQKAWGSASTNFPGPQPVSIERRHFSLLRAQPYYVCEKTDGVRHVLISTADGVFLVNRAFEISPLKLRVPKDTVLDGELVQLKNGRQAFVVHDAIQIKGENVRNATLEMRLEKARAVVRAIIKTASAPCEIRVKSMWRLGDAIPDLNSFDYETDGLVFTPIEEPIRTGTHETMFKWKPRERITVDFELRHGCDLYIQEKGDLSKEAELHLHNKRPDLPDGTIVECGYGELGWFVEKVRTDKTYPNNRRTFQRTIVNLREAISLQEFTGTTPCRRAL